MACIKCGNKSVAVTQVGDSNVEKGRKNNKKAGKREQVKVEACMREHVEILFDSDFKLFSQHVRHETHTGPGHVIHRVIMLSKLSLKRNKYLKKTALIIQKKKIIIIINKSL